MRGKNGLFEGYILPHSGYLTSVNHSNLFSFIFLTPSTLLGVKLNSSYVVLAFMDAHERVIAIAL